MDRLKQTLYDVLGVGRNAKLTDIGRAYNRLQSELRSDTAPPDPRRAVLVREAYEVLSDPQKREAYDASLRRDRTLELPGGHALGWRGTAAVGAAIALLGVFVVYIVLRPAPAKPPRLLAEIQTDASLAVGRVQAIGLSGKVESSGVAFTLEQGVMVTPCVNVPANSELVVLVPSRRIPARLMGVDASKRFCRLEVAGGGSWPLMAKSTPPIDGETVYAADVAANGEVVLREGRVKTVRDTLDGRIVDATPAVPADSMGRPLLDADGRLVAVALHDKPSGGQYVVVPTNWIEAAKPKAATPVPAPEPEADAKAEDVPLGRDGKPLRGPAANISKERRDRLEKAFRPPPTVPDDL